MSASLYGVPHPPLSKQPFIHSSRQPSEELPLLPISRERKLHPSGVIIGPKLQDWWARCRHLNIGLLPLQPEFLRSVQCHDWLNCFLRGSVFQGLVSVSSLLKLLDRVPRCRPAGLLVGPFQLGGI